MGKHLSRVTPANEIETFVDMPAAVSIVCDFKFGVYKTAQCKRPRYAEDNNIVARNVESYCIV
jgi:hypothetical protein